VVRPGVAGRAVPGHPVLTPAAPEPFLVAVGVRHAYRPDQPPAVELDRLELPAGATLALTGPSGSGKTTLAYLLTGIERVRQGSVSWGGTELHRLSERERDAWRLRRVGFVFQDFHLVPGLPVLANVLVSCWFDRRQPEPALVERARELLDRFAVPRQGREVTDLSRGEQQRVAVARALLRNPSIVVADEPTASLDAAAGATVIGLLLDQVRAAGATFLAVTHDPALVDAVDGELHLRHGRLTRSRRASSPPGA
jgi:putative ABC transport system ATP-binding protein